MQRLDDLLICRLDNNRKQSQPCTLVIFGATGDLTARKLMPSLFHLFCEEQLPLPFRVICVGRRDFNDETWRERLMESVREFAKHYDNCARLWYRFSTKIFYCKGDISDHSLYTNLHKAIAEGESDELKHNLVFYLATAPDLFTMITEHLSKAGLLNKDEHTAPNCRLVLEKPFGTDAKSAKQLNARLTEFLHEKQLYRIDHYLGKETVQNLLTFRFSNAIFEPLWNQKYIDHVQITVSEKNGIGSRGGYYDHAGALRDMMQNHILQILALISMEPPVSLAPEAIRDEKVKLLKSIRPIAPEHVDRLSVRGQYTGAQVDGRHLPAYRQEERVAPGSNTETYAALSLRIDNWRWGGVPFYLRTGKNLAASTSQARIQFRMPPPVLFASQCGPTLDSNSITLRLQPDEGITLRFNGKIPGLDIQIRPVRMNFNYQSEFGAYTREAYERLLMDAMAGDSTLFIRRDEVETAWDIVEPLLQKWSGRPLGEEEFYPAGSWGPENADALPARNGHNWRNPDLEPAE